MTVTPLCENEWARRRVSAPGPGHHLIRGSDMAQGTCSIDGCESEHVARSWCASHYKQWQRHGDPLVRLRSVRTGAPPPVIDGRVPLASGGYALVDPADSELVGQYKWSYDGRYVTASNGPALHKLLLPDAKLVDHVNRNPLDCRRANLRAATSSQNSANRSKQQRGESPYKGVFRLRSGRWQAVVQGRRRRALGTFDSPEDAARAYDEAAIQEWGEFAATNVLLGLRKAGPNG